MKYKHQLNFLSEKIQELQTAILTFQTNSILKFPASVIETHYIDEIGCIWIATNMPGQNICEFDNRVHVCLNYYKKGKPFFLNAQGIARIVLDPEEVNHLPQYLKDKTMEGKMLICIRILEANFYQRQAYSNSNFFTKLKQAAASLFNIDTSMHHFNFNGI